MLLANFPAFFHVVNNQIAHFSVQLANYFLRHVLQLLSFLFGRTGLTNLQLVAVSFIRSEMSSEHSELFKCRDWAQNLRCNLHENVKGHTPNTRSLSQMWEPVPEARQRETTLCWMSWRRRLPVYTISRARIIRHFDTRFPDPSHLHFNL